LAHQAFTVTADEAGMRLDKFLAKKLPGIPPALFSRLMRKGAIRVAKGRVKGDRRLVVGEEVRLPLLEPPAELPESGPRPVPSGWVERMPGAILYQDEAVVVVDKPPGMVAHAGSDHPFGLIDVIAALFPGEEIQLVHRLDRDTTGVVLLAKGGAALRALNHALAQGQFQKQYVALSDGIPKPSRGSVDVPLTKGVLRGGERMVAVGEGGERALTTYKTLAAKQNVGLIALTPHTGRTHQLRVHLAHLGTPIVGDRKYGKGFPAQFEGLGRLPLCLHAFRLSFPHPTLNRTVAVTAPLPEAWGPLLERVGIDPGVVLEG